MASDSRKRIQFYVDEESYNIWRRLKPWQRRFAKQLFVAIIHDIAESRLQVNVIKQVVTLKTEDRLIRQIIAMLYEVISQVEGRKVLTKAEVKDMIMRIIRSLEGR